MRSSYKITGTENIYFITSTIVKWIPIFTTPKYLNILFNNLKFYQKKYDMEIFAYVFMSNHFHLVCRCQNLKEAIQSFKSYTAKKIINELENDNNYELLKLLEIFKLKHKSGSKYQIWQEGYHPKQIIDSKSLVQKINYIHHNPVRKGLVSNPTDWKYSSAKYILDDEYSEIKITRI